MGRWEANLNQKRLCLPPWRATERALSDAGERHASTQPPDRTSLICQWNGRGRSDKGQGSGCDKEGPYVLLWPQLLPWLSVARGHPGAGSLTTTGKVSNVVFSHTGMKPSLRCGMNRMQVCMCTWRRCGGERERETKRQTEKEGQLEFRAARSLTLQERQIASGSRYLPLHSSVLLFIPFLPPRLPLSFLSNPPPVFVSRSTSHFPHSLFPSFWFSWRSVLLGGVAQSDNVCREAVFEQDTSVSLAVQLSDETVPVDDKPGPKSAVQNKGNKASLLLVHHRCHLKEF